MRITGSMDLEKEEVAVLLQYIAFMEEFDDDPDFRDKAISAEKKLKSLYSEM